MISDAFMKPDLKPWRVGIGAAVVVVGLWLATLLILPRVFGPPGSPGGFGDMFGAINALFTGLALAGVAVTVWIQRVQFEHQLQTQHETEQQYAQQLEIARQELAMERERIAREAEPLLIFSADNSTGRVFVMTFVNRGGAIKHVTASSGWAKISFSDDRYLGRDQEGVISFVDPANPTYFYLEYVRIRDGGLGKDRFVFNPETMKIVRVDNRDRPIITTLDAARHEQQRFEDR